LGGLKLLIPRLRTRPAISEIDGREKSVFSRICASRG